MQIIEGRKALCEKVNVKKKKKGRYRPTSLTVKVSELADEELPFEKKEIPPWPVRAVNSIL